MSKAIVKLGEEVKDTVTNYKGIVICISEFLNGCRRIGVQAKMKKDGTVADAIYFDEPQLRVVGKGVTEGRHDTGGPISSIPTKPMNPKLNRIC